MDKNIVPISDEAFPGKLRELIEKMGSIDISAYQREYNDYASQFQMQPVEALIVDRDAPYLEHMEKTEQYQSESLKILESIKQNTANLYTLVDLINRSNEQQDALIGLIAEIMAISKAKNKEEADSFFRKTMDKASKTIKDGETLYKIAGYAMTVYNFVTSILQQK